jgi:hypothetical protein
MKSVVILLVCVVSFNAVGQMDAQKLQSLKKVEKYRRVRNLGLVMVIAGATMGVVGFSRLVKATAANPARDEDAILWIAGAPFFSTGIPLSIVGHNNMRKYEKRLQTNTGVSLNFQITPKQQGLILTYKF